MSGHELFYDSACTFGAHEVIPSLGPVFIFFPLCVWGCGGMVPEHTAARWFPPWGLSCPWLPQASPDPSRAQELSTQAAGTGRAPSRVSQANRPSSGAWSSTGGSLA